MFIMPCESGDFTNRIMIIIITRHGNSSTRPRGIDTDELPFSRILRRKKDNRGEFFSARRGRSSSLSRLSFEVGSLLVISCRKPMVVPKWWRVWYAISCQWQPCCSLAQSQAVRSEFEGSSGRRMNATVVDEERATCSTQGAWSITSVWVVTPGGCTRTEMGRRLA